MCLFMRQVSVGAGLGILGYPQIRTKVVASPGMALLACAEVARDYGVTPLMLL